MKLYDISQELFTCAVYPGDRSPRKIEDARMAHGDLYNLTSLEMCAHNGTHIDAPFHFFADGEGVDQIPLKKTVGYCYVTAEDRDITEARAQAILAAAGEQDREAARRILIKGKGVVTLVAAEVFAKAGIDLIGVESQTVGPEQAPMAVHLTLLAAKTVLLEGIRLDQVQEGVYFLSAAPLSLKDADGAPCRAFLIEE